MSSFVLKCKGEALSLIQSTVYYKLLGKDSMSLSVVKLQLILVWFIAYV